MSELFYKLNQDLAARKDLNPADKLVYAIIANYQGDNLDCWPSLCTLGNRAGIHRGTALRSVSTLEKAGLIEVVRSGQGKVNHYRTSSKLLPVANCNQLQNTTATSSKLLLEPVAKYDTKRTIEENHIKELDIHTQDELPEYDHPALHDDFAKVTKAWINSGAGKFVRAGKDTETLKSTLAVKGLNWCLEAIKKCPDNRYIGQAFFQYEDTMRAGRSKPSQVNNRSFENQVSKYGVTINNDECDKILQQM
ncbi:MAG: helix-turn-helix domain-containing protein [Sedimentisphaerales bacterium]|nr:helix-turn-helix domain-containing protein [Sedimentisphaerales bacterium]